MTANIHPSNLEYYHAVLDNLRAGREHGLQYKYEGEWVDYGTEDSGMPFCNWCLPGCELRMKPEAPAHEMIKIGALELPRPAQLIKKGETYFTLSPNEEGITDWLYTPYRLTRHLLEKHELFASKEDAKTWRDFFGRLRTGDPETIAAITQQAELDELAEELELQLKAYASALARIELLEKRREVDREVLSHAIDNAFLKSTGCHLDSGVALDIAQAVIAHLNAKPVQQREIDRDALVDAVKDAKFKLKGFKQPVHKDFAAAYIAKAVIEHLNTKPATQEPKNLPDAPESSLPSWRECKLRVYNSDFIEQRVKDGGYGADQDSMLANNLHRFIYEYDDADPYKSRWFRHRLELALNDSIEPKELKLPDDFKHTRDSYRTIKEVFKENADLFRDRGITLPKDLQK